MEQFEIRVSIPDKCRLVGTRTDEKTVIVIYEAEPLPSIGFRNYPIAELSQEDDDEDEEDKSKNPFKNK